jgi:hypothetical protein
MAPQRDKLFKLMLTDDEREMLRGLAEGEGLTASDFIRQFIRREHARAAPLAEAPAPKKRPKRK